MRPLPVQPLTTARLALAEPTTSDAADIVRHADDYDLASRLARLPHPYGADDAAYFLAEIMPAETVWTIRRREDRAFVGVIGLSRCDDRADAELGYWLGRPFWGAGLATEAALAVVAHADRCGLRRLYAGYFEFNPASGRVLEKAGFVTTGRSMRGNLVLGGERPHVEMMRTVTA